MQSRQQYRRPIEMLFNKYLGGHPYLCRTVDLTSEGLRAEIFTEPEGAAEAFPLELRLPSELEGLWIWARSVWTEEREQAVRFVSMRPQDRARLERFLVPSVRRPIPAYPDDLLDE